MSKQAKRKWYVVWKGRAPGIYTTWADCEAQVKGFGGAQFKAFESQREAQQALYTAWYVVWHGRTPGLHQGWPACQSQIHGFEGFAEGQKVGVGVGKARVDKSPSQVCGIARTRNRLSRRNHRGNPPTAKGEVHRSVAEAVPLKFRNVCIRQYGVKLWSGAACRKKPKNSE
jgi:hypothetical protein